MIPLPPPPPPHTHFLENYFAEVKIKKLKTIFIDIYNNQNNFKYIFLLFLNFTKIL